MLNSSFEAADVQYATGFTAVDPFIFLQLPRKKCLVVSRLELGRARRQARDAEVFTPEDLPLSENNRRRLAYWALGLLKLNNVRHVVVGHGFPLGITTRLRRAGIRVELSSDRVYPEREVKSAQELACLRQAQRAAAQAMHAAIQCIRAADVSPRGELLRAGRKLTADDIREVIDHVLLAHDCIAHETNVACGQQSADPHERGFGVIRAGEPIVMDIFPRHRRHGYWGDITRTIVKGRAPARLARMYRVVRAAQQQALKQLKAGVSAARIHMDIERLFERSGFKTGIVNGEAEGFIHSTGHGVGLEIHESPTISPAGPKLKCGQVVTIEPGLYYKEIGGVRIEDTVVVTKTGFRYLATCEKPFEVA